MGILDGFLNSLRIDDGQHSNTERPVHPNPKDNIVLPNENIEPLSTISSQIEDTNTTENMSQAPQTEKCIWCFADIPVPSKFCPQCGKSQSKPIMADTKKKESVYMSSEDITRFARECNEYVKKQENESDKSLNTPKEKQYKVQISIRNDDTIKDLATKDLSGAEKIYLEHIYNSVPEDENVDLFIVAGNFRVHALKLLLEFKHINEKMISYAFNIKMLAAYTLYYDFHEVSNLIDDNGNLIPSMEDEINNELDLFSNSKLIVLNKKEKQIFDSISGYDLDEFILKSEEYITDHPDAELPSDCSLVIKTRNNSTLNSLIYEKLSDKEREYLEAKSDEIDDNDIDDFNILYHYSAHALELAKEKGHVNTRMVSYAFDIDMITAFRILQQMHIYDKVINADGTVNSANQQEIEFYSSRKKDQIWVTSKDKELFDSIPKCDFETFKKDVANFQLAKPQKNTTQESTFCLEQDDNSEDLSSSERGIAFEEYCVSLLKLKGYINVSMTEITGDHGIDILAEKDDITYAIQCKYYSGNVGNSSVQEAFSGKAYYNRDIAVVMTNSQFTDQAIEDASRLGVKLWDGEKIKDMFG